MFIDWLMIILGKLLTSSRISRRQFVKWTWKKAKTSTSRTNKRANHHRSLICYFESANSFFFFEGIFNKVIWRSCWFGKMFVRRLIEVKAKLNGNNVVKDPEGNGRIESLMVIWEFWLWKSWIWYLMSGYDSLFW